MSKFMNEWKYLENQLDYSNLPLSIQVPFIQIFSLNSFFFIEQFFFFQPQPQPLLTWCQFLLDPGGSFFQRLTNRTHALQISPVRVSSIQKHFSKSGS